MSDALYLLKLRLAGQLNRLWTAPALGQAGASPAFMLEAGLTVGQRYQLERVLGEGSMGRVWLARDLVERRPVALKEMRVEAALTPTQVEESAVLFRREFFSMKKLQHPLTVQVFDCGVLETGDRFLTMEVVKGRDLIEVVRAKPLDSAEVFRVLIQLAQVLAFIHSRFFVHSDIKAENIRLTDAQSIKLMDFGLMHQLGTVAGGQLKGTPSYMAPEWPKGGVIDGRADLYSLGVLGFFLLTGKFPFTGRSLEEVLDGHLSRPPPKPSQVGSRVDPKLEAIVLQLLHKEPAERPASASALAALLAEASGQPLGEETLAVRTSYLHVAELVGREAEAGALARAYQAAKEGKARAVLVGAPAGTGKSRLMQELELKVKFEEVPYAVGQCRAEGVAPLTPLKQALTGLLPVTPPEVLAPHRALLGKLLPEVATEPPPTFKDPAEEKSRVFAALGGWLRGLSERKPFVVCLEDIHWADSATLEHLNMVIRALAGSKGLVLATFRSDELDRLSLAFQTVDEGVSDRLELAQLSPASVARLVELALLGFRAPADFLQRLQVTTGGNAFFVLELLRALIEEGLLTLTGGRWSASAQLADRPLPTSIQETVQSRLRTLPQPSLEFFRAVAPAGRVVELGLLAAISDLSEEQLFDRLAEGVERQFLQFSVGKYFFTHDTVRSAIYADTPEEMRRHSHVRIGRYFEKVDANNPERARTIGYHFSKGGDARRAIGPLLKAGDFALANKALLEATMLLKEGATLLEATPDYPEGEKLLLPLWGKLVEVGFNGHPPTCLEFTAKLFQWWNQKLPLAQGGAEIQERFAKAEAVADAARRKLLTSVLREIPVQAGMSAEDAFLKRAELRILQGVLLGAVGKGPELEALVAGAQAEQPVVSPYRHAALLGKGILKFHLGEYAVLGEIRSAVEALRTTRREMSALPRRLSWALGLGDYLVNMYLASGGQAILSDCTEEGTAIAQEFGFNDIAMHHLNTRLTRACFSGDGGTLPLLYQEVSDRVARLGGARLLDRNFSLFVPVYYLERHELELAEAAAKKLKKLSEVLPDRFLKLYAQVSEACLLQLAGRREQAEQSLPGAVAAAKEAGFRLQVVALAALVRLELARGNTVGARAAAEEALQRATSPLFGNPFDEILARRSLAAAEVNQGEAVAQLQQAAALAATHDNRLQEGACRLELAAALLRSDRSRAAEESTRAGDLFEQTKATAWLHRVEKFRQGASSSR